MKSFFYEEGLVRQHLDSYNEFIVRGLQEIVDEVGEILIESPDYPRKIKFGKITVGRPLIQELDGSGHSVYPMEARLRNLAYAARMHLEMSIVTNDSPDSFEPVYIGVVPIMLKSERCLLSNHSREDLLALGEDPDDPGGYFIVNGSERMIVGLEDLASNRILVDIDTSGGKRVYIAKVFSTTVGFKARMEMRLKVDGNMYVSVPGVAAELPFVVLMRALGVDSDKAVAEMVSLGEDVQILLEPSFEKAIGVYTPADAILYIGNRVAHGQIQEYRLRRAESVLNRNLLPHVGTTPESFKEKAQYLGEMASRVIELKLGRRKPDDKDHYANKRLRLAGPLLADLFRIAFRNLCRDVKYQLERMSVRRRELSISLAVRPGIVTDRMQHAIATGNWGRGRIGITQLVDRTNYISMLSHLRRLQSPLSRSQPNFEARDLHPTHFGRLCPNETPEGSNCGLVKNLSPMASISIIINAEEVKYVLRQLGVIRLDEADEGLLARGAKVFIDGYLLGYCGDPDFVVRTLRDMRRRGEISPEVNVVFYREDYGGDLHQEVYVNCDEGRVRRPLIVVEDGVPRLTPQHISKLRSGDLRWGELVKTGIVEWLDAEEEENALVALDPGQVSPKHTHLEIAPYAMLGICTSIIPYAEHNQSPRNSYEAAMAKQALGIYGINYFNRFDSRSHLLHNPQRPLVETRLMGVIGYDDKPSGQNCVVAVISFEGYNMEDAIVFNKSSIDRGLLRSTFFRVYEAMSRQYLGGLKDVFEAPEPGIRGYRGEQYYRFLEEDGTIALEAEVNGGDVLVGRSSPPRFLEDYKEFELRGPTRRDTSVTIRPSERGTVDDFIFTESIQGSQLVKARVRDERTPEVGDKFASRHGQKGVIGMVVPQEDMPFTQEGVVPDIIINPHTIPSRMTIGQFIESAAGKVAALQGRFVDGTPFVNEEPEALRQALQKMGFQHTGREVMYNGVTGEKFEAEIFIGIVYYQKLHHMVADKIHARARGQVQMLTRQPTEGRARGGGLRFGEMERDCLIGHGAASLLKDRLLEESDKTTVYVCEKCGYIAYYDLRRRKYTCKICGDEAVISPVAISYAFKLLLQELMSLCISPRLHLKERA